MGAKGEGTSGSEPDAVGAKGDETGVGTVLADDPGASGGANIGTGGSAASGAGGGAKSDPDSVVGKEGTISSIRDHRHTLTKRRGT